MLFSRYVLVVAVLLSAANSFGSDFFKVAPYSLKHTNGHLLLNFQLNQNKKLVIEDGAKIIPGREYVKDQHYQIELSVPDCGVTKDLLIRDSINNDIIFTRNFPQPSCASSASESEFVFGFISDTQQYTDRHEAVAKVIAHHHAIEPLQFIINGGDVVQNGHKEQEWIEYFKGGNAYLLNVPQIAAIGNHDYRGDVGKGLPKFFQKYMRWEGAPSNGNLFFEMPGFQLIIWNSNISDLSGAEEKIMWAWLEEKMQLAQKFNTPLIIATHFPVFSSSMNRFTSFAVMKLRSQLVPLVEKYGVKLVLGGHTHMFERSFKDGVNYLVAGPAGGRINKPTLKNKYMQSFDSSALTFTKIKYNNKTLRLETFNQDNIIIDQLFINL